MNRFKNLKYFVYCMLLLLFIACESKNSATSIDTNGSASDLELSTEENQTLLTQEIDTNNPVVAGETNRNDSVENTTNEAEVELLTEEAEVEPLTEEVEVETEVQEDDVNTTVEDENNEVLIEPIEVNNEENNTSTEIEDSVSPVVAEDENNETLVEFIHEKIEAEILYSNLEFTPNNSANHRFITLALKSKLTQPQNYFDLESYNRELETLELLDSSELNITVINVDTLLQHTLTLGSISSLSSLAGFDNSMVITLSSLPQTVAKYKVIMKLENEKNSSIITSEVFSIIPKKEISSFVTVNNRVATFKISVLNPDYVNYIKVDVTNEREETITLEGALNEEGEISVVYTGTVGSYKAITRVGYSINGELFELTEVHNTFNLTNQPVIPEPIVPIDRTAPVLTLNGDANVSLYKGRIYRELNATAIDNEDGDLSSKIIITGKVNSEALGVYILIYSVTDSSGNRATITRTVNVIQWYIGKIGQIMEDKVSDNYDRNGVMRSYFTRNLLIDNVTGLMWQDDVNAQGMMRSYSDATIYCHNLILGTFGNWRLPGIEELVYLADKGTVNPVINQLFEDVISDYYWSSTRQVFSPKFVWIVDFNRANQFDSENFPKAHVRCVREGQ